MSEEKKISLLTKITTFLKALIVAIIIVMLGSFYLGSVLDCESFNRFVMQNIWDGGINCPVE